MLPTLQLWLALWKSIFVYNNEYAVHDVMILNNALLESLESNFVIDCGRNACVSVIVLFLSLRITL